VALAPTKASASKTSSWTAKLSADVLERQEPFVNSTLAQHALALLARLFRYGRLCYHGGFISLSTGVRGRLPIDASL
jgi:hypothetical protein